MFFFCINKLIQLLTMLPSFRAGLSISWPARQICIFSRIFSRFDLSQIGSLAFEVAIFKNNSIFKLILKNLNLQFHATLNALTGEWSGEGTMHINKK